MAEKKSKGRIKVKLNSSADTGYYYTTTKKAGTDKLKFRKYDPVVRKHVEFNEGKIK